MTGKVSAQAGRGSFTEFAAVFAAAPHRMLFFAGSVAVLLSMGWWAAVLVRLASGAALPLTAPPGWVHAALTQFGMLPPFIFGFLLTVFPRWLGQEALARRCYVPVFGGILGGYLLAHAGLLIWPALLPAGFILMLAGWALGLYHLAGVLRRQGSSDAHALSCFAALGVGGVSLALFSGFLCGLVPPAAAWLGLRAATFLFLLPLYFTVCHRMVPFFSGAIVGAGYRSYRPAWSLPVVWLLLVVHVVLDVCGLMAWLWLPDMALALLFALHALRWQPWRCVRPGLLLVLHLAFVWLPAAFVLYAVQSASLALYGQESWGRGPLHALTVGFFGSMLVAMVTRVTQGHSGRPLQMSGVAWFAFGALQVVAVVRVVGEQLPQAPLWLSLSSLGWLLAFLPWVLRHAAIYWRPRADGRPG
ncbi:NnrS family protein [Tahibacter harae]|uniref:NnrS family protein n=1 Tax=Tahibacter harae TaxID=2963937 RepID=A0ABT1QWF6_9GAMM|nr:NnrS family protein [Tahibacter harae]